jgi:hypothetical protein
MESGSGARLNPRLAFEDREKSRGKEIAEIAQRKSKIGGERYSLRSLQRIS